jgi:hypothetical protein
VQISQRGRQIVPVIPAHKQQKVISKYLR